QHREHEHCFHASLAIGALFWNPPAIATALGKLARGERGVLDQARLLFLDRLQSIKDTPHAGPTQLFALSVLVIAHVSLRPWRKPRGRHARCEERGARRASPLRSGRSDSHPWA